jgi:hypothetical protein
MRHRRGSLMKEIKTALFRICNIPEIKSNAGPKIRKWKTSDHVINAYSSLWNSDDNGLIVINQIIIMAIPKESNESRLTPSIIAFTLAVCCVVLNPYSDEIKCTEESIKKRYTVFLVSIIHFIVKFIMR